MGGTKNRILVDQFARRIEYLRVSVTHRCNMRCSYCYNSNSAGRKDSEALSNDELLSLIEVFSNLGVRKVRFTGGEPLLRPGIAKLVQRVASISGIEKVGITTNGRLLVTHLPALLDAGLNSLNISLDSLKRNTFLAITGFDCLSQVLSGIENALKSNAFPFVKINTVVLRGMNDTELVDLAEWALRRKIDLRFIEFMPTHHASWSSEKFVPESEIRERLGYQLELDENAEKVPGPARRYRVSRHEGRISFISAVSRNFCGSCNRVRLTLKGELIGCLYRPDRLDLGTLLREGADPSRIAEVISNSMQTEELRGWGITHSGAFRPHMMETGG